VPYTVAEIAARDDYHCGLCGDPVDMSLSGLDRRFVTAVGIPGVS
jgi:hypothetical protein